MTISRSREQRKQPIGKNSISEARGLSEGNAGMQVVLLRVAIDTGSGGIHGPLYKNGEFEFVPIPDRFGKDNAGVESRTYGTTLGRTGRPLLDHFPARLRNKYQNQPIHFDPEFETFTYGDPIRSLARAALKGLKKGDMLVFYAGLKRSDFRCDPSLYIIGYFEVKKAVQARDHGWSELRKEFGNNFHVRHRSVFKDQRDSLTLVKGNRKSRLLKQARRISVYGPDKAGKRMHVLSPEMRQIF